MPYALRNLNAGIGNEVVEEAKQFNRTGKELPITIYMLFLNLKKNYINEIPMLTYNKIFEILLVIILLGSLFGGLWVMEQTKVKQQYCSWKREGTSLVMMDEMVIQWYAHILKHYILFFQLYIISYLL